MSHKISALKVLSSLMLFISSYSFAIDIKPDQYSSHFFRDRMSSNECTDFIQKVIKTNAHKSTDSQLNTLLDSIAVECGINEKDPEINFAPVMYIFEKSDLKIYWDGDQIYVNDRAQFMYEGFTTRSFKNIIVVRADQLQSNSTSNGTSLVSNFISKLNHMKERLVFVKDKGETYITVAGYAYHDRRTYTPEKIKQLNELAWGIGIERLYYDEEGHREGVSMMVIKDSHSDPQFSASYEWQAGYKVFSDTTIWGGYSAGIVARSDYNYKPIPYLFPTIGLSIGKLNLKSVLIPSIGGVNNGNVLFIFASIKKETLENLIPAFEN